MQKDIHLRLQPSEAASEHMIRQAIALQLGIAANSITGYRLLRRSVDARSRNPSYQLQVKAFINEPVTGRPEQPVEWQNVAHASHEVLIAGAGPAGLFAALKLIELGIRPIILERGKDVRSRRRDLAALNRLGQVNPESNYCFGEGGAGTYSDGKLYTRSTKRGNIDRILNLFVQFGADEKILYDAHPHIGTNKLPHIIMAMREKILACGGQIHFQTKLTGLAREGNRLTAVQTAGGVSFPGKKLILATGHSARDVFQMLWTQKLSFQCKPFALGVRVEHPQSLIDSIQYHCPVRDPLLPPAPYSLVQQVEKHGVFSFCMCPGGIIAPAATNANEIVVNGWSPSRRDNPYANSGIVVTVDQPEMEAYLKVANRDAWKQLQNGRQENLTGMVFQQTVEQRAFQAGGGNLVAPALRLTDFCEGRLSATLPHCSYHPGLRAADLRQVLPPFVYERLAGAFREFGKKMKGYYTNEAVVVATESRTSSPVTIPRHAESLQHPELEGLYPCGEGAGYAGGIMSAAMDGERVAEAIYHSLPA